MSEPFELNQQRNTRQLLFSVARGLLPDLLLNVVCMLIVYNLLQPHFPPSSIVPLLAASLCPLVANLFSIVWRRHLDVFGIMVLIGLVVSIIGVLLGGNQQLLLIRESFVTGAIGLAFLLSLISPKSLGYYFARQFLTANDPQKSARFASLWQDSHFRGAIRGGTVLWGVLLLTEFALRVIMVLTLPVPLVLTVSPLVFNALLFVGIAISAIWAKRMLQQLSSYK